MIIQQDQRPKDWAYKAVFKEKDLPSLEEMVKHIRETHDVDMIEDFNSKCEQKLTGQQQQPIILDNGVEIQSITKTNDLVTNPGLQHCINLILGISSTAWSHILTSAHSSSIIPTVNDTTLNTGSGGPFASALNISLYGWSEPKGMKLFFGAFGSQDVSGSMSTSTVNEMAVYSGPAMTNIMFNHETFFNNPLTRNFTQDLAVYANVFILSCVIEFCPVA